MKKRLIRAFTFSCVLSVFSANIFADAISYQAAMELKQAGEIVEAELAFIKIIEQEPNNHAAIEQLAVVQSWQSKFDLAIGNFRRALLIEPNYTPARLGLARVSYWNGKREMALSEIEKVIQAQPDVPAHWILKGDILMADTQQNSARESYLHAQALSKGQEDPALAKKIVQAKAPNRWRLDTGYIGDTFSADRVDGHSAYLQLGYTFNNKTTLYVRAEEYLSFGSTDTGVVLGAYYTPHKVLLLNTEYYRNNNDAHFRPSGQLSINADFLFNETWQPLLSYRHATYKISDGGEGEVDTIMPGLRLNYQNASLELRHARSDNIDDTITSTNTLKLNMTYARISPYVFFTKGEEGLPPLDIAEISVIGAGAVFHINDSLALRLDLSREDRKDTYIHNAIGAGLSMFF